MKNYIYNINILTNEDDVSYYLLGAFISDGNIHISNNKYYTSSIGSIDKDWIDSMAQKFSPNLPIKKIGNFYNFRMYNPIIGKWFISHNCIPNKSLIVTMPTIPSQYIPDFIRGVFDGDGCMSYYSDKNKIAKNFKSYICGSSLSFLKSLKQILLDLNIHSSIYNKKQNINHKIKGKKVKTFNEHWRLELNKTNTMKFLDIIYYQNHKISLNRKFKKYQTMKQIYLEEKLNNNMLNKKLKIQWPSNDKLIQLISENTYMAVSRLLGVSNTAIRCYMKNRGIFIPKISGSGKKNITIHKSKILS
ncbi:Homing endonuclease, LAGLIDADG [uncultured Caudovirales phage]|uniref:Homing endonuclease, LAGLIDADG n=1 Tax=uncultured Caudovirales phage TaxID=2100421 RepID=A0A6J5RL33_9CAUD|nr:Homing endonuclease, LAGLIDADG [uncultured Caudovirales phage]